jgi:glycosyltransferase involved in cell wall biosynthesis
MRPLRVLSISAYPFWDDEDRKGMPSIYLGHKAFVDAGHDVVYLQPGPQSRHYSYDGITMRQFRLRFPKVSPDAKWTNRLLQKLYYPVFLLRASTEAVRVCREFPPDVVYGQLYQAVPVAWLIGRLRGIPNVTRMYGTFLAPWVHSWKRWLRYEEVLAFKIPCSYLIMTNDGTRGDDCARALSVPPERLKFWRNGVNKDMYDPQFDREAFRAIHDIPSAHKVVLALCRLERWKGVDRLLAALPEVLAHTRDVTVMIVGDGPERERLRQMATTNGSAPHVRFVGAVHHDSVSEYLNGADVFVSLYHYSNAGNPLLEALCCGKCIVSINNGATGQLITHGVNGLLVEEDRLKALPSELVRVLTDDGLRKCLSDGALAYARGQLHTWPQRVEREVTLIEQLVNAAAGTKGDR